MAVKLGNGQWAVKENNLLAYNDNSGQFFNKEFDFTRGSSATYVGKDGLIKTAGLQDTNLVQNGDFSQLGSELVVNGDFATDSDWVLSDSTILNGELNISTTFINNTAQQSITNLTVGASYKIEYNVNSLLTGGLVVYEASHSRPAYETSVGVYSNTFIATATTQTINVRTSGATTATIDNISVKQVDPNDEWSLGTGWSIGNGKASCDGNQTSQTTLQSVYNLALGVGNLFKITFDISNYSSGQINSITLVGTGGPEIANINANGSYTAYSFGASTSDGKIQIIANSDFVGSIDNISVQEVQVNTPRIDFSDSVDGALLLEPQSTNLIPYSEDFSQSSWNKNDMSIESGYLAPDGTNSAYKITKTGSNAHLVDTITGGNIGAKSIYAKTTSGTGTIILFNNVNTYFTITEDWQRFEIEQDGLDFFYAADFRDNSTLTEIIIWGAQSEALSYATSYIPTQGSSSTRIAETCNNSGSAQDFNSEEGVLFTDIAALAQESSSRYLSLNDGTTSNRIRFGYTTPTNSFRLLVIASSVQVDITKQLSNTSLYNKFAIKYKQNDFAIWVNGFEIGVDTSGNTPSGISKFDFDNASGGDDFYGKTKQIQYYDSALTDEELEYITSFRSLNELVTTLKLNKL
jgi:hypothetical protein